ncbi:MAG: O-antigen ligase family protein [Actinobacteria bacterium]|nr:MAG: O-antigen ligase family protein [Actinomycetota bacterium]TML48041.1 MAG: O-antigen ligase family protein [Actinomycetota bacterium]TML67759.1 MAG: O-antigen ligase family protein [Actinomycetota bacterium]
MANPPLAAARIPARRVGGVLVDRDAIGALLLALSLPFLFLHERFQPDLSIGVSSTTVDIRLSDLALLAVVIAALGSAKRYGLGRLRAARGLWLMGALLLAWLAFETIRPASVHDDLFASRVVTAFKLGEYALLALAVPLLVRRIEDLTILLGAAVLWGAVATAVAVAQFFGLDIFGAWNPGWRQPSFLGHHDFASLSAIATSFAAAGIVAGRRRMPGPTLFAAALVAGVVGLIIAGSVTAAAGFAVGALVLAIASRKRFSPSPRRLLALGAVVLVVAGGITAVRADSLADFMRFIGVRGHETPTGVESYSQRTVLAYIGFRIFEDHPVLGVGWQRSSRPDVFEPYLADARRRFPDVVALAFPSAEHPWGVQNLYIQMLADAGVVGLFLLLAVGVSALVLASRTAAHASTPWAVGVGLMTLCGILTVGGVWGSLGIVTGIPLQAATSLLLGLAAAGAATVEDESSG